MRKLLFKPFSANFTDQGMYHISTVATYVYIYNNAIHVANYL